jgi:Ankyrin repeats (many copies)/Ankyrin repeats (3 copies)
MFEYLTELYLSEKARRLKNPVKYDADSKAVSEYSMGPHDKEQLVNFYMAVAIRIILPLKGISPQNKIPMNYGMVWKNTHTQNFQSHAWTELMIMGMLHPDNKFDHRSIERSLFISKVEQSELGYFTLFSATSLYETEFKLHLNKGKVLHYLNTADGAAKKSQEEDEVLEKKIQLEKEQQEAAEIQKMNKLKIASDQKPVMAQKQQAEFKALEKNQALLSCINNPDAKLIDIKGMLDNGAELNYQDKDGYTALMLTIKHNNEQIAEYLLKLGANPLLRNKQGKIASELAAHSFAILPILKGYELLSASSNDDLPTITTLIMHQGCDVNFRGHNGKTALLLAVAQGQIQLVRFLLANHADITLVDKDGQGVFDLTTDEAMLALLETAKAMPASVQQTAADTLPDFKASADGPALTPLMAGDEMFGLFAQTKSLHQEAKEKTADLTP